MSTRKLNCRALIVSSLLPLATPSLLRAQEALRLRNSFPVLLWNFGTVGGVQSSPARGSDGPIYLVCSWINELCAPRISERFGNISWSQLGQKLKMRELWEIAASLDIALFALKILQLGQCDFSHRQRQRVLL